MIAIESLEALAHDRGAAELLEEVGRTLETRPLLPADIERWRRRAPADMVTAAVEVAMARRSLRGRIASADAFWADRAGAMQASDDASAAWKAQRGLAAALTLQASRRIPVGDAPLLADYCCGTGADLAHFALALDGRVEGVDLREERAWMARRNAHAHVQVADVRSWRSMAPLAHIDPSRRDELSGSRSHSWGTLEPGPDVLGSIMDHHAGVMVKLGPGTDVPPEARPPGSELIHLSRDGALTQALLCTGVMAEAAPDAHPAEAQAPPQAPPPQAPPAAARSGARHRTAARAVLLRSGQAALECAGPATWSSGQGSRDWRPVSAWGSIVAEPDPSLERSGLLPVAASVLGLAEVHAGLGLCTNVTDHANADAVSRSPWWCVWDLVAVVPGRLDSVSDAVSRQRAGLVEVKVRGGAASADEWSRSLRGTGHTALTVFVHRTRGGGSEALVARRRT